MRIVVRAFASARETLGVGSLDLDLGSHATVADAWTTLQERFPQLRALNATIRLARNARLAALTEPLADGDELALLPPVGGG